jgi:hypothetical protein
VRLRSASNGCCSVCCRQRNSQCLPSSSHRSKGALVGSVLRPRSFMRYLGMDVEA